MSETTITTIDPVSLTLPQVSVKYLRQLVNTLQWADSPSKLKHGGDAFELIPEPVTEPVDKQYWSNADELTAYREAVKVWADKPLSFSLSAKQFNACKFCLEFYLIQKKAKDEGKAYQSILPPGPYTNALIKFFNIEVPEDDEPKSDEKKA